MHMPLVSVAIPFRDSASTLPDAIRSIFAQTFEDWELLLLDDGSRDHSLDIARSISDPRVRVFSDGTNKGLAARLTQAAAEARAPFLFRMDADDLMLPHRIERQLELLTSDRNLDLVGSGALTIDAAGNLVGVRRLPPFSTDPRDVLRKGLFIHPTVAGRREWFLENPYSLEFSRAQDYELWNRTCRNLSAQRIDEPLIFYRDGYSSPRSFRLGCQYGRRIYRQYGPRTIGRLMTTRMILRSIANEHLYSVASLFGMHKHLVAARSTPLPEHEHNKFASILAEILTTKIPGLD